MKNTKKKNKNVLYNLLKTTLKDVLDERGVSVNEFYRLVKARKIK
jgi:hypothetical protein